jgi:acyl dehydratase
VIGPHLLGREIATLEYAWDDRAVILYALSVGAQLPGDLALLYEKGLRTAPTFALAPMAGLVMPMVEALGLELRALLHAGQELVVDRPMPPGGRATVTRRVIEVVDKGRAALMVCEDAVADADGLLATGRSTWWIDGAGGFGGERAVRAGVASPRIPERAPDVSVAFATSAEQAALHRLSGDRNPVHIDPEMAIAAGQPRPFLHGLCTFGALGLALDRAAGPGRRLASLAGHFTRPVFPGDVLELEGWWTEAGEGAGAGATARAAVEGETVLGPVAAGFEARG